MNIALTSIMVDDPIKAFKFYTGVLGFREKLYMPEHYLAIVVADEDPNGTAIILEPRGNLGSKEYWEGIYNAGMPMIVLGSKDINVEYEQLKSRGVVFRKPPTKTDWGVEAVFEDTCGNLIQIAQQ